MFTVGNKISGTYSHLRFEGVIVAFVRDMVYVKVEAPVKNLPACGHWIDGMGWTAGILSFHVNETDPAKGRGNVVIDQPPAPAPAPTLTADEIAVLEIIEMGWYTYLKAESKDDTAGRLWGKNLTDYTPTGLDMQINADGIAALDLLDPNRTSKAR